MSTQRTSSRWVYPLDMGGNGFSYDNLALTSDDVVVTLYDATGALLPVPPYSVIGAGLPTGGLVQFENDLARTSGGILVIELAASRVSVGGDPADYIQDPAKTRAFNLDQRLLLAQQLWNKFARVMTLSPLDPDGALFLPPATMRANTLLGFDAAGLPMASGGSTSIAVSPAMIPVVQANTIAGAVALLCAAPFPHQDRLEEAQAADVTSDVTTDLSIIRGNYVRVSGVAPISSFGVSQAGAEREVEFTSTPRLVNNANLILPGNLDIAVQAGDVVRLRSRGAGVWKAMSYQRASGEPLFPAATAISAYLFMFDQGAAGFYTLATGTNVTVAFDQDTSHRDGVETNAAFQPDISAGAINSRDALQFQGDEKLTLSAATSVFRRQSDVCLRFSFLITAAPTATQVIHRIDSSVTNASLINLQLLTSRCFRMGIRMRGSDAILNLDCSTPIAINVPAAVSIRINTIAAQITWRIDYRPYQVSQALSGGVPGWPGGQSYFEDADALVNPTLGRAGGTTVWKTTQFEVLTGRVSDILDEQWWLNLQDKIKSPKPTTSINPQYGASANKVWLSNAGAPRNINVGCTVIAGADAMIQYRLLKAVDGSVIAGLANLGNSVNGKVTAAVAIPRGPACFVEIRKNGEPDYNAVVSTQRYSVGLVGMWTGASNSKHFWSKRYNPYLGGLPGSGRTLDQRRWTVNGHYMVTDQVAYSQNSVGTGEPKVGPLNEDAGGQAMAWTLNDIYDATGYCQEILAYSIGSSPSGDWMEMELPDYPVTGPNWQNILNSIGTPGGPTAGDNVNSTWEIGWWLYMGGEFDSNVGVTGTQFYANLKKLGKQYRTRAGDDVNAPTHTPYFIVPLGRINTAVYDSGGNLVSGASPDRCDAIRQAQLSFVDTEPMAKLAFCCHDRPLGIVGGVPDNQHYSSTDYYDYFHYRFVQTFLHYLLPGTYTHGGTGPKPVSATIATGSDTIVIACALDGGTQLVDGNENPAGVGLDGFRARSSTTLTEYSGVVGALANSTNVYVQVPGLVASPADPPQVFVYSGTLMLNNVVRDDTRPGIPGNQCTIGCPLQPSRGWLPVTVT